MEGTLIEKVKRKNDQKEQLLLRKTLIAITGILFVAICLHVLGQVLWQKPAGKMSPGEYVAERLAYLHVDIPEIGTTVEVGSQALTIKSWVATEAGLAFPNVHESRHCILAMGGLMTVEVAMEEEVLVRYTPPVSVYGTSCDEGVYFRIAKDVFFAQTILFEEILKRVVADHEAIRALLATNYYGETFVVEDWEWVDVLNLDPVLEDPGYYLMYGDTCGIDRRGVIQTRGYHAGRTLYQYSTHADTLGTACPSGILFWK